MGMDHFYKFIMRKTSTYTAACVVGALVFEQAFEATTKTIFDDINHGKQWADIKKRYDPGWKPSL